MFQLHEMTSSRRSFRRRRAVATARRVRTFARWLRYSASALPSVMGSVPSAACSAAARISSAFAGLTDQRLLDAAGAHRHRRHVGQRDPGLPDHPAVDLDGRGHRHDRPGLRDPVELLVPCAAQSVCFGNPHLGEDFVRSQRGGEVVHEEFRGRRCCAARRARGRQRGVSASAGAHRSPAGSACASAPPSVPRCRICGSATVAVASASSSACSLTSGLRTTS